MAAVCIVGSQWGDEGKGKVIDLFAQKAEMVVRWAGGNNAGHTIRLPDGREFILHLLPGGIFKPGVVNVLGGGMVVDPWQFLAELDMLAQSGIEPEPGTLLLSHRCHLVLPWHRRLDRCREAGPAPGEDPIGTTGRGIGPCYEDKASRKGLRLSHLARPERLAARLEALAREKNALLTTVYGADPIDPGKVAADLAALADRLLPLAADTDRLVRRALSEGREILFEGAQGVLLDLDLGTYPFVTSSNASSCGLPAGAGVPPRTPLRTIGIAKAYCTRVGEGPFPSEITGPAGEALREAGREFGATTGRPRRCGWFDAVAGRYAVEVSGMDELFLTKLDVLSGMGELRIVTAYEGVRGFPADREAFDRVRTRTEPVASWSESLAGRQCFADLPPAARAYVARIEELVGVPVTMISLGPGRREVIPR